MNVTYLHFGGTNYFVDKIGVGPYVVGGIGLTFFDPAQGYSSELRPSGNLGIGYQMPLGGRSRCVSKRAATPRCSTAAAACSVRVDASFRFRVI